MNRDPRISMDTVRAAYRLVAGIADQSQMMQAVRDAAKIGQICNRIRRLNEDDCNLSSGNDARDLRRDRLLAQANAIAGPYGARVVPYGEGGGLWPHMVLADGSTVTP